MRRALAILCAGAATAAAAPALAGCGGGERRGADVPDGTYDVAIERASFRPRQHLAQRNALVIAVRNTGERAIPNLAVTVRGFSTLSGAPRETDFGRDLWIVDSAPAGARTAFEDTWTTGRLAPGSTAELRWEVTPVTAGTHELTYEVAPALAGDARARLASGRPAAGSLTVRVSADPPAARVVAGSGAVRRQE